MLRVLSWLLKIVPSIFYVVELNIFMRDTLSSISQFWKNVLAYGIPSAVIIGFLLYFTFFRDMLIRVKAQEQFENEERSYTVGTQTKRLFRVYIPIGVLGATIGAITYFYKPYIILLSIKIGILYSYFILGEVIRIVDIGRRNNKKIVNKIKQKKES